MTLVYIFAALCAAAALANAVFMLQLHRLRRAGMYPLAGQAIDQDISRLVRAGHSALAMRCHREVHKSSLRGAKAAVSRLQSQA